MIARIVTRKKCGCFARLLAAGAMSVSAVGAEAAALHGAPQLMNAAQLPDARLVFAEANRRGEEMGVGNRNERRETARPASPAERRGAAGRGEEPDGPHASEAAAGDAPAAGGAVAAESSAAADVSTSSGVEADAASGGQATAGAGQQPGVAEAESFADTAVHSDDSAATASKTRTFSKEIDTKFGAVSLSRSMTTTVLEDGTRVKAKARSRAMALDTPGVTKTTSRSDAEVRVRDLPAFDEGAVSEANPSPGQDDFSSAGFSSADAD
mgnify:CR=1 FL=1